MGGTAALPRGSPSVPKQPGAVMQPSRFESLMEECFVAVRKMQATKGRDYSGADDSLHHLRSQALELDLPIEMVWAVLARKHWSAILAYCKQGQVHSEPIESRLLDLVLYCILLLAISREDSSGDS